MLIGQKLAARVLVVAAVLLGSLTATGQPARAEVPVLTTAQRQAYLYYYAPLILKRGDENDGRPGRDWLTNYDFDQDGDFSTNRVNWASVQQYVNTSAGGPGPYDRWRIRPTIYTSLLEFADGGGKSLVLLYHVYNAADKEGSDIHDWERIEIILRGVTGTPGGAGEFASSATVTHHHDHIMKRSYDAGLNFMQTATGRHLMVWQADTAGKVTGTHGHELRFVTDSYAAVAGASPTSNAQVHVSGKGESKNVHYAFVPQASPGAVAAWGAQPLSYANAAGLASRVDNETKVDWWRIKRLTYELQDLADVLPTHWQGSAWWVHWLASTAVDIELDTPVVDESGQPQVGTGRQRFYTQSRDIGASDLTDGRDGIPSKNWFYGSYSAEQNEDMISGSDDFGGFEGRGTDSYGMTRGAASGRWDSHGAYWWQHDYFVHSGGIDTSKSREVGQWLPAGWQLAANGGFDGRWVQLFDDRPGQESTLP